jgi:hypothetical protein
MAFVIYEPGAGSSLSRGLSLLSLLSQLCSFCQTFHERQPG